MYECVSVCVCFVSAMGFPNTASLYTTYVYTCVCVCILCVLGVGGGKGGERPGANQDWHHQHVPQKRDLVAERDLVQR